MDTKTKQETNKKQLVLMVEDEHIVQRVHRMMLEKIGCEVDLAETGKQALEKFTCGYDVIFMDLGLPDMDGKEVVAEIRCRESSNKHTRIIVLTGYLQNEIEQECLAIGANAVYRKPIDMAVLDKIFIE